MIMRPGQALLLPVNPLFIALSLLVALALNMLPIGPVAAMPDLLALVLVFWNVHQPRRVGMVLAFVFGLVMDVHSAALLGQHALAYTLLAFGALSIHRRLLWFSVPVQALQVLPLFLAAQLVTLLVRLVAGDAFPGLVTVAGAAGAGRAVAAGKRAATGAAAPRAGSGRKSSAMTRNRACR